MAEGWAQVGLQNIRLTVLVPPGDVLEVTGYNELMALIASMVPEHAEDRVLLELGPPGTDDGFPGMHVGVSAGDEHVPVLWRRPDGDDDIGGVPADSPMGEDELEYMWGSDYAWYIKSQRVPAAAAHEAIRLWLETGARPKNLTWDG